MIAAVLLIAFTMAVAGLAGPYLTEITQKAQGDTDEKVSDVSDASNARVEIMSADFDSTTGDYTITIRNTGTETMENFTVTLNGDNPVQKQVDKKLEEGKIHTFTVQTSHSTKANKITTESRNLPVETEIESENIEDSTSTPKISWNTATDWDNAATEKRVIHESFGDINDGKVRLGMPTDSDLLGYWSLDTESGYKVSDHSENSFYGTRENDATDTTQGLLGTTAYKSDGTDDYINLTSRLDSLTVRDFTVTGWFKPREQDVSQGIIQGDFDWNNGEVSGWQVADKGSASTWSGYAWYFLLQDTSGNQYRVKHSSVTLDEWHHFAAVLDEDTEIKFYIDGDLKGTTSISSNDYYDGTNYASIGSASPGGEDSSKSDWSFRGSLDDIRIYNKSLQESKINDIYWSSKNGSINTDWKSFSSTLDPSSLSLEAPAYDLNSDGSINVTVESDTDGDGNSEEISDIIELDGSSSYSVSGLSTNNDKFRLDMNLSTSNVTKTPTLSKVSLKG